QYFAGGGLPDVLALLRALHYFLPQRFRSPFRSGAQVPTGSDYVSIEGQNPNPGDLLRRITNKLVDRSIVNRRVASRVTQAIDRGDFAICLILRFLPYQAAGNVVIGADGLDQQQQPQYQTERDRNLDPKIPRDLFPARHKSALRDDTTGTAYRMASRLRTKATIDSRLQRTRANALHFHACVNFCWSFLPHASVSLLVRLRLRKEEVPGVACRRRKT